MFVYGTQYLRGATPERDQWKQDMQNMKALGFNTIRAWLVWNCLERKEGEIDCGYLREFLQLAEEQGLQVGLLFHLHACPAWAVQKYPQYFYVSEENHPFEPAVRSNTPSSGFPGLCFDHEEVRALEERFISAIVSETRKFKNIAFYEPMNEPHQWVDMMKNPTGIFCYCPATVKKFQAWLQKKYGTVEALNQAWGYFYSSFEEVRPPRWNASYCDYTDFRLFEVENIAEEVAFRTAVIRKWDSRPVIAHAWGGGSVTCNQLGAMAFDDWKNAAVVDKWGYSAFPRYAKDCVMLGMGCDATRCAANGKEYWQSELTAGVTGSLFDQKGRIDPKTFDKFTLESIRHGAEGLLFWQYRKERIGAELGGYSLTDFDGGPTPLTEKAKALGKLLADHGERFKQGKLPEAEVALVFSIRSYFADWSASNKRGNKDAVDSMSGYYRMFWEENIAVDIIHEENHPPLSRYRAVVLPSSVAIAPAFAAALKEYLQQGGLLLSEQMFGLFDPTMKLSYQVPGYGFGELFGARQADLIPQEEVALHAADGTMHLGGNKYTERYKDVTAEVLYAYEDGSPAILSRKVGQGEAILSGVNLGRCYSGGSLVGEDFKGEPIGNNSTDAKAFVLNRCYAHGVKKNACSVENVKVSVYDLGAEAMLVLINSAPSLKKGAVSLEKSYHAAEVLYGNGSAAAQGTEAHFTLGPDECMVVRLY